jgi:hypothetical protein
MGFFSRTRSKAPGEPDAAWLAAQAANCLTKVLRSVGLGAAQEGSHVSIGRTEIYVDAHLDNRVHQGGKLFLAAELLVSVDGTIVPAFRAGVVGVDATLEGARDEAAAIWCAVYGHAIGYSVARWLGVDLVPRAGDLSSSYLGVVIEGETLYRGVVAMRGAATDAAALISEEFLSNIARRVVALLGDRNRFCSATIKLHLRGPTVEDGECRVNGSVSADLLAELKRISWPEGNAEFDYTLFFAVAPDTR